MAKIGGGSEKQKKLRFYFAFRSPCTIFANKKGNMFNTIIALVAFAAVSLIGWGVAELKSRACGYVQNEEEKAVDDRLAQQLHENGFHELSIKDVIKSISTKGFTTI